MPNYKVIGGAAYQPGSAAAIRAQQLYNSMPRPAAAPNIFAPPPPRPSRSRTNATVQGATVFMPKNWTRGLQAEGPGQSYYPAPSMPQTASSGSTGGSHILGASVYDNEPNLSPESGYPGAGAFGLIPEVPNPTATAGASIGGNIGNLGDLSKLGTGSTKLAADLAQMPYMANLPGYGGLIQQSSQDIASNLAGVIDPTLLIRHMAERGVGIGMAPGSQNSNTALAIALQRSIDEKKALGQQQLNAAIGRTPTGQPFNIAAHQIYPGDMQAAQFAANTFGAAPDPSQAAQANLDMQLKAIEAGRAAGMGGVGGLGGGGGSMPRVISPGGYGPVGFPAYPQYSARGSGFVPRGTVQMPGRPIQPSYWPESVSNTGGLPGGVIEGPDQGSGEGYLEPQNYEDLYNTGGFSGGTVEGPDQGSGEGYYAQPDQGYSGTDLDPWTQEFLQQFGIDWSLPDYGEYEGG